MEKRRMTLMLAAISMALLGLLALQAVWARKTVRLRDAQFKEGVNRALIAVSDELERFERMRELRGRREGRKLLARLDSLNAAARYTADQQERLAAQTGLDIAPAMERLNEEQDDAPHEELATDMLRTMLSATKRPSIQRRVNPRLVDSLLKAELASLNLRDTLRWGLYDQNGDWVDLPERTADTTGLRSHGARIRLFRHDIGGTAYFLHVRTDRSQAELLSGVWPTLLATALLAGIILFAFLGTLRSLARQKRLIDIRTDLVNNLTHELKTPISTIGLACEALSDPSIPRTEEQIKSYTAMIRDENKRLGALVENVLLSAVQDGGNMVVKPVDLDLHAVIADVARSSSSMLVSRRNGIIETELRAEIHRLNADRIHITNLITNLVDNAVKYTEREPRIRIATRSDDMGVWITVTDNGIGIAASEQRKVFDKLYRVPTGNLHNTKGFGLGLSYVKNVVDRHGGRIRLESTPGQGSAFHIFLPFEHEHAIQATRG
ncbi:MAG: HAMP domain-containing histidine kinase [Flavobacteriales bacterium]|nr:HAMP domain-containing histidine kinase [Flavobacteriales bacterium]